MPRNSHLRQNAARVGGKDPGGAKSPHRFGVFVGLVLATSALLFVAAAANHYRRTTIWVVLLFLIPIAVQTWGLLSLWMRFEDHKERSAFSDFYLATMAVCLFSYSALWFRYSSWEKQFHWLDRSHWNDFYWQMYAYFGNSTSWLTFFSGLALVIVLILLLLAVRMTLAIIEGERLARGEISERKGRDFWNIDYLRSGASREPFLSLLFFFTVFLSVSYLFGLALAFHDKSKPPADPALYMRNHYSPRTYTTKPPKIKNNNQSAPTSQPPSPVSYVFRFGDAQALVPGFDPRPKTMTKNQMNDWQQNEDRNKSTLVSLISAVLAETNARRPLRIVLTGFADKKNIQTSAYKSNYELGIARSENIKHVVSAALTSELSKLSDPGDEQWRDVEWTCLSASNEQADSERAVLVQLEKSQQDKLTSELLPYLSSEHSNPLDLMDYVYFANYTITTTGYGDIVPNDLYTKFICSFANICEVFFLVVFFNVLLSLKVDRDGNRMLSNLKPDQEHKTDPVKPEPQKRRTIKQEVENLNQGVENLNKVLENLNHRFAELERKFKGSTIPKEESPANPPQ